MLSNLRKPHLPAAAAPLVKPLIVAAVVGAVTALMQASQLGQAIETHATQRLAFYVRAALKRGPGLDARIKIFSYDDGTVAALKDLDLPLNTWQRIFTSLAARQPRGIFLDKLFDRPQTEADQKAFADAVSALDVPVVVAAFVANDAIKGRLPLPLSDASYRVDALTRNDPQKLAWLDARGGNFFGAPVPLARAFRGIGHAVYNGDGFVRPLHRIDGATVVPHWSLFAAHDITVGSKELVIDGASVKPDADGRILVNMDAPAVYAKRAYAMLPLVTRALAGQDIPVVNKGDIVIILPAMYTGNTDWKETPHGSVPGGYVMAAMMNSVLTGQWLIVLPHAWALIVATAAAGVALGALLNNILFWSALAASMITLAAGGLAAFAFAGIYIAWMPAEWALLVAALAMLADRQRLRQLHQVRMQKELETARLVQDSFFAVPRASGRLSVEGFFHPASECGGDWWGHFAIGEGCDYVVIGDATGHGVSAALVTAMAFSTCHSWAHEIRHATGSLPDPGKLLERLNKVLCETSTGDATMTFFVALFEAKQNAVTFSNAGHNFPFLIARKGDELAIRKLTSTPGPILGILNDSTYPIATVEFRPGDKVFFYTDGLIENQNPAGKNWGYALQRRLRKIGDLSAASLRDKVAKESKEFIGSEPPQDDSTVVVVESLG